ncbi:hypothetical protein [Chryseobacterium jejuense]|uniref:hypothetical protein n=1 Tax=Chryseobacterium jejuense TaxID=445960 RepID=UPI001AE6C3A8|nr:hypothetical protein [Chryseobacterium jejuense]MBP2616635.1 hypothetical protein [Chryseobacterium jejuense]
MYCIERKFCLSLSFSTAYGVRNRNCASTVDSCTSCRHSPANTCLPLGYFFNEVQYVLKNEATDSIYYNIVKVTQHEQQMSLKEACIEDLRLHNEDLKGFLELQANLPDFGIWQDVVVN